MSPIEIYALAIGANLSYSTSSMIFSVFAKRFSSMWMNQVKSLTALVAFLVAMILNQQMVSVTSTEVLILFSSGFLGLCLGDMFLFKSFTTLGPARSLVLYSFQPLLLGIYGYFFLGQVFNLHQGLAVLCMMICIFIFMLERLKLFGTWDLKSFFWAFLGITLDAIGVMLTRQGYEFNPGLETFQVNVIRCLGAVTGFILISPKSYLFVARDIGQLQKKEIGLLFGASFVGCFLSLTLYLSALKFAHVASLTAISITGPVWVSLLESVYEKKLPSLYLCGAFLFFVAGFYLMI